MAERALPAEGASGGVVLLDAFDRGIVTLLAADARLSIRAIARELSRSPGAVGERLARLESAGVIAGYYADIDYTRLGYMQTLLGIRVTGDEFVERCVEAITALPEVRRAWVVTGSWAIVAEAHVRDAAHLRELLQVRMRSIDGVQQTEAMIVLETATAAEPSGVLGASIPLPGSERTDKLR